MWFDPPYPKVSVHDLENIGYQLADASALGKPQWEDAGKTHTPCSLEQSWGWAFSLLNKTVVLVVLGHSDLYVKIVLPPNTHSFHIQVCKPLILGDTN